MLFDRLVLFIQTALAAFSPIGISATLETSMEKGNHVHGHLYFHLANPFCRRSLSSLVFEGIMLHIKATKAKGPAYKPAYERGHFYVVVDKIGSIFNWTNFAPSWVLAAS